MVLLITVQERAFGIGFAEGDGASSVEAVLTSLVAKIWFKNSD